MTGDNSANELVLTLEEAAALFVADTGHPLARTAYLLDCSAETAGDLLQSARNKRDAALAKFAGGRTGSIADRMIPSPDEIAEASTPAGGWTRATLAQWGVPWPPPSGWRKRLERLWHDTHPLQP